MSSALVRPLALDLESFARLVRVHPQLVRRLVAIGLLEASRDASGQLWIPSEFVKMTRLQRVRTGFSMICAAFGNLATCHRPSFIIDEVSESVHRTT